MKTRFSLLTAAFLAAASIHSYASAETVLRLDEVPVGEIDPAKATDYADSVLMFNLYDTLVIPKQGQPGYDPFLATGWESDGKTYTFKLRTDVKFQSGNPVTAEDIVFSFDRMKALGQGLSYLFEKAEKEPAEPLHGCDEVRILRGVVRGMTADRFARAREIVREQPAQLARAREWFVRGGIVVADTVQKLPQARLPLGGRCLDIDELRLVAAEAILVLEA